jgi:hypothetical protein
MKTILYRSAVGFMVWICFFTGSSGFSATLTVKTNILGSTPSVLGYNSGHFYTNSNTGDWWRYSGVTGARVFFLINDFEFSDVNNNWGDGVTNLNSFTNRRALLRAAVVADPNHTDTNTYINWTYLDARFKSKRQGDNKLVPDTAFREWTNFGISTLVNMSASSTGANSFTNFPAWPDTWELWHRYYEAAFYMAQHYNTVDWQMYNEPNGSSATLTNTSDYLGRLYYASDAIQSAIADVNAAYQKNLAPQIHSPVTAGGPQYSSWGSTMVSYRHKNYLGVTDPNYWLFQVYDYHEYDQTGSQFGSDVASLQSSLKSAMSGETPFPTCISEFDDYIDANTASTTTMDSTANAALLGSIAANLALNFANQFYCFKFSQTTNSSTLSVTKNALHWVDNTTNSTSYNIGGITKSGEVWRLFNKACSSGKLVKDFTTDSTTANLDAIASYDSVTKRYYLFSANNNSSSYTWTANFSAWNIPANQQVLVEEVSSSCYGAGKYWTNLDSARTITVTQGANTVLLFTVPSQLQLPVQTVLASNDATVTDGANAAVNYGSAANLLVRNHSTDTSQRSAALVKFHLPQALNPAQLQLAVLSVTAASINGASTVQAHVYGITNNSWSQGAITWSTAPNLAHGMPAGSDITNNFVAGAGDATRGVATPYSAQLVGQLVAGSTAAERTIDVTDFLKRNPGTDYSFLLAREVRYSGDTQDTDGISIVSTEGSSTTSPRLKLVLTTPPAITGVINNANHTFTIGFLGAIGQTYQVQGSTNLASTNWTTLLTTNITSTNWVYIDTQATNFPLRYYRAVSQ